MNSFNKTETVFFSCRLCFLRAFPFFSLFVLFITVDKHLSERLWSFKVCRTPKALALVIRSINCLHIACLCKLHFSYIHPIERICLGLSGSYYRLTPNENNGHIYKQSVFLNKYELILTLIAKHRSKLVFGTKTIRSQNNKVGVRLIHVSNSYKRNRIDIIFRDLVTVFTVCTETR